MKRKIGTFLMVSAMFAVTTTTSFAATGESEVAIKPDKMPENKVEVQVFNLEDVGLTQESINRLNVRTATDSQFSTMAAGWQMIGYHNIWPLADNGTWNTKNWDYISGSYIAEDGGNVGVSVNGFAAVNQNYGYIPPSSARIEVMLYEDDGVYSDDDFITRFNIYPFNGDQNNIYSVSINDLKDGTNGKAEVEARYTWNFTSTTEGAGGIFD
jgi:hypothetical protein